MCKITKEQIIDIARDELTPIGWHEEHAMYIDGLDAFAERLLKLCNISHVSNSVCDCGKPIDSRYAPCCSLECWDKKFIS
jgi:hypothetical protein